MNVNDITENVERPEDMLEDIFLRQVELAKRYHHIEEKNGVGYGLLQSGNFNINETRSQSLLKDFAWRVVEELTEATESIEGYLSPDMEHVKEELADSLHFLVELCLLVQITPDDILSEFYNGDDVEDESDKLVQICYQVILVRNPYKVVQYMGNAMNCLKQKPWKQTHILTDEARFKKNICAAFLSFIQYWCSFRLGAKDLYDYYFKKNKVNNFRIETKY